MSEGPYREPGMSTPPAPTFAKRKIGEQRRLAAKLPPGFYPLYGSATEIVEVLTNTDAVQVEVLAYKYPSSREGIHWSNSGYEFGAAVKL